MSMDLSKAAHYEAVPRLREVAFSACMSHVTAPQQRQSQAGTTHEQTRAAHAKPSVYQIGQEHRAQHGGLDSELGIEAGGR